MDIFGINNPGYDLNPFTAAEMVVLQSFADLGDPNANRLVGWDDTDNAIKYFTLGTGLVYTHSTHTLSVSSGTATLADGNYGDVTVSGSGTAITINSGVVSLAKMANVATGTIFYRKTAGTGTPEVQTLATLKTDLGLTGTNSGDQTITLTGHVTGSGTGSFATATASKMILQGTTDATATAAQFLGALATGILKNTTTTGVLSIAVAADFPTLNQSTTGSAATLTTPRAINGVNFDGSAAITVTAAAGTLTGTTLNATVTASSLTSFGTSPTLVTPNIGAATGTSLQLSGLTASSAVATDASKNLVSITNTGTGSNVLATSPTLVTPALGTPSSVVLTNATGTATGLTAGISQALASATTTVNVSSSTAPTSGQVLTATGGTAATWQTPASGFANPMTTLGDIIYENATPAPARLAGSTSATKQFLTQTGNGTISAAPGWATIAAGDIPTLNQNTTGSAASFTGSLAGDVTGTQGATVVGKINGTSLAGLATGILKNTTATGVPSIAVAADFPTLNQNTTGNAATVTTNANLTGVITSVGNATSIASQTGTGTKFVVDTTPTLVTPILGVATATSINKLTITAPTTSATLTILTGKTLTVDNTLELAGTDATVMTFPSTNQSIAGLTATQTMTNKRITPRVGTETSSATSTPTSDASDMWTITALAAADAIAAPSGAPTDGQRLIVRIKDNATGRALTWNAIYRASSDLALPTTTIASKTMYCGFIYNFVDSKWDFVAFLNNF